MNTQDLEMVICPICHKPFPKKRLEMGYRCCVSCSKEKAVSCIVEGTMDGDGDDMVQSDIHIFTADIQAQRIQLHKTKLEDIEEVEDAFEESSKSVNSEDLEKEEEE